MEPTEYLAPGWDPASAKIAQLRSILLEQEIPYSSNAKKLQLVNIFLAQVRPRAPRLLAKLNKVKPSDSGILDGESQDGSLRELDTSFEAEDEQPVRSAKGKARASTSTGRGKPLLNDDDEPVQKSRSKPTKAQAAALNSDSEDEIQQPIPPKRRISQLPAERAAEERRKSLKYDSEGESGFSDFNPFQSGGESPDVKPRRRKSSIGPLRKTPIPNRMSSLGRSGSPEFPPFMRTSATPPPPVRLSPAPVAPARHVEPESEEEEEEEEPIVEQSYDEDEDFLDEDQLPLDEDEYDYDQSVILPPSAPLLSGKAKLLTFLALSFVAGLLWREGKIMGGYCDAGSKTNSVLTAQDQQLKNLTWTSSPPLLVLSALETIHLRPTCTPCPAHARCSDGVLIGCEREYVVSPHPLGFSGVLPFAASCRPDTAKLMAVAMQASKAARLMRIRRGEVVCGGEEKARLREGKSEAWTYGLRGDELLDTLNRGIDIESPLSEEAFEDINRLAIADLQLHGEVSTFEESGTTWYSVTSAEMPLLCSIRLAFFRNIVKYRNALASVLLATGLLSWLKKRTQRRISDKKRVRQLVADSLQQLQDQERLHYTDPTLAPTSHLAPSHLRDLVLSSEHSPARRQRLWSQVERIVEGNSNVRAKEVLDRNGEEMRAWEWVGGASRSSIGARGEKGEVGVYPSLS